MFKLMFTFDDFISRFWRKKKQLLDTKLAAKKTIIYQFYTGTQETDIVNIFLWTPNKKLHKFAISLS